MFKKLNKSKIEGFTIIEVMIVLAIAGLIILIVLLAVPALQRNSRNTAIKNDASAVAAAVTEFESNNDGAQPTGISTTQVTGAAGTTPADFKIQGSTSISTATAPGSNPSVIQVLYGKKCSSSTSFTVNTAGRSTAILYNIETSSNVAPRCIDA